MPETTPIASVVMTVYNERPDRLTKAVRSILSQTLKDIELVLVDDGSSDPGTVGCLDRLVAEDPRITFIRQPNLGIPVASNAGIRAARGALVFRHDSDDWSDPVRFERQVAFMAAHPHIAALGTACQLYKEDGRPFAAYIFPPDSAAIRAAFPKVNPIAHGAACIRREAILAVGGYREQLRIGSDYDLFWRLNDRWPAANLTDVLYHRIWGAASITARSYRNRAIIRATIRILAQSRATGAELPFETARERAMAQVTLSDGEIQALLGDEFMRAGLYGQALATYAQAIAASPWRLKPYAKLARLGLYAAVPPIRHKLFHEEIREMRAPVMNSYVQKMSRAINVDIQGDNVA